MNAVPTILIADDYITADTEIDGYLYFGSSTGPGQLSVSFVYKLLFFVRCL